MSRGTIVMIMSGFPRRSETFALNELLALNAHGLLLAVFATKPGDGAYPQPGSEPLLNRVHVLQMASPAEQAAEIVERLTGHVVTGVHGYFAHTPAEVAAHVAQQLGVPYSFSVHARDARKLAPGQLARRAAQAACVIACNPDVVRDIPHSQATLHIVPHGVDLDRFQPQLFPEPQPLHVLAVGRLVAKKGFDVLIDAVAQLPFPFQLRIVGDGPEREQLAAKVAATGLSDRVQLCRSMTHTELPGEYAAAHVVVVPSIIDPTGDRDGLPNVVLEAMASGRAVIASDVGAIPSAISNGESGMLVPPGDCDAIAAALQRLVVQPHLLDQLGHQARQRVQRDFELCHCTERLRHLLETTYA